MISDEIRKTLKAADDGMTIAEIARAMRIKPRDRIDAAISRMVGIDVYVSDWQIGDRGKWEQVYKIVRVPENAPKPTARKAA